MKIKEGIPPDAASCAAGRRKSLDRRRTCALRGTRTLCVARSTKLADRWPCHCIPGGGSN